LKQKREKENFLSIGFCDDSTSPMTGDETKKLETNDNEDEKWTSV